MNESLDILGIPFQTMGEAEILRAIVEGVESRKKLSIVQPHFFHTLLAYDDPEIGSLYKNYDLILPDGYGIFAASRFLYGRNGFATALNGSNLHPVIMKEASARRWRVFFLGETDQLLNRLRDRLRREYPGLVVAGTHQGFIDLEDEAIPTLVNESRADLLLVGMGTPKQDRWLWRHYDRLDPMVSIAVGAGIAFMSGTKVRASGKWQKAHGEWLFRLLQEPRRLWRRYLLGIPRFLFLVLREKLQKLERA